MALLIRLSQLEALYDHAERSLPLEAVALLFGQTEGYRVEVGRIELMENTAESSTSFEVDPEKEYKLLIDAEEKGQTLVGIFHSHPAPPEPSSRDRTNMKLNPVIWLIASKLTGEWECDAYLYENEFIQKVDVVLREL
jgi:proteasome lid subunit RPN8/RPN11